MNSVKKLCAYIHCNSIMWQEDMMFIYDKKLNMVDYHKLENLKEGLVIEDVMIFNFNIKVNGSTSEGDS